MPPSVMHELCLKSVVNKPTLKKNLRQINFIIKWISDLKNN